MHPLIRPWLTFLQDLGHQPAELAPVVGAGFQFLSAKLSERIVACTTLVFRKGQFRPDPAALLHTVEKRGVILSDSRRC